MKVGISVSELENRFEIHLEQEYRDLQIFRDEYEDILNKDYILDSPEVDVISHAIDWAIEDLLYERR